MTVHIDAWGYRGGVADAVWNDTPHRLAEGEAAVDYWAKWKNVRDYPYFNGYSLTTPLHDDGECEQFQPTGNVWQQMEVVEGKFALPAARPIA